MDLAKDRHRLTRQGHDVRRAGLRHRVAPLGPLEVDAGPLRRHQLAEAHEHQRCKTERATYGKRSGIAVQLPEQRADLLRIRDRREVLRPDGR